MQRTNKLAILAVAGTIAGLLVVAGFAMTMHVDAPKSWKPAAEGFLAVATPCCTEASLWDALDAALEDGQHARPASTAEAADWLNAWPYRPREKKESQEDSAPPVAMQGDQVRCIGAFAGSDVPRRGDDEETLDALRGSPGCAYVKWKVWTQGEAKARLNERHAVWVDDKGFFRGRVDYWR